MGQWRTNSIAEWNGFQIETSRGMME